MAEGRVFERLEPDEGKLSRPVLRGGGDRKVISLPDQREGQFSNFSGHDVPEKTTLTAKEGLIKLAPHSPTILRVQPPEFR